MLYSSSRNELIINIKRQILNVKQRMKIVKPEATIGNCSIAFGKQDNYSVCKNQSDVKLR